MNKLALTTAAILLAMTLSTGALAESYISYDENGNISAVRVENNGELAYSKEYNSDGQVIRTYQDLDLTFPDFLTTKRYYNSNYTYNYKYNANGYVSEEEVITQYIPKDQDVWQEVTTTYFYDYDYNEDGTIKTKTITDSSDNSTTYEYSYDSDDNYTYTKVSSRYGTWIAEAYDSEGRLVLSSESKGLASPLIYEADDADIIRLYRYNEDGTYTEIMSYGHDGASTSVRTDYDENGNIIGMYTGANMYQYMSLDGLKNIDSGLGWKEVTLEKDSSGKIISFSAEIVSRGWTAQGSVNYAEKLYRIYTAEQAYAATSKGNNNSISIRFK